MSRQVRRVPGSWEHPKQANGRYVPLDDGLLHDLEEWQARGEPAGERPDPASYMPDWPVAERTHYQMYETTTEGTPMSPPMATPEELARWLVTNRVSLYACGKNAVYGTYGEWLRLIRSGDLYIPSVTKSSDLFPAP
jgi:hypothetical protein